MVITLKFDKHIAKWHKIKHPQAEKKDDPEKNPNYPHWAGLIGGPRFNDSFDEVETANGYWDPNRNDVVILEPCIVKKRHVNRGKTNEALYYMVEYDKPHFGRRTVFYNQCLEGYEHARALALRHQPRQIHE